MPGALQSWPAWPEFGTQSKKTASASPQDAWYARSKAEIISEYGEASLRQSWLKTCESLSTVTSELSSLGADAIPVLCMSDISANGGLTEEQKTQLEARGCCVVRGVLSEEEATEKYRDLKGYIADNAGKIAGWPEGSPSIFRLYNSDAQVSIRTHPNQLLLQRCLNALYHDTTATSDATSAEPLSYADAARIRPPGQPFLGLGPHIDAGSLCRWADEGYRRAYGHIFSGFPERHDIYDLGARKDADQGMFPAPAHSCVFRAFQGWTALTEASARCGTLLLYPNVRDVVAYMLLRPFFKPPTDGTGKDVMDGSTWTFDPEGDHFPGTFPEQSQRLSISSHPHLRLDECMTYIPEMKPGDTVWWHTDMCHAVDPEHDGTQDASVVYVPACPTTPMNRDYVKRQLQNVLSGLPPPDRINAGMDERTLKGWKGFDHVSNEGKKALGFGFLE